MATLRLFAAAREAAGEARTDIAGATVGEILATARGRYGEAFAAVLERSRVWVNGQPAEPGDAVKPGDIVAVLPPVSGGAARMPTRPDPVAPTPVPPGDVTPHVEQAPSDPRSAGAAPFVPAPAPASVYPAPVPEREWDQIVADATRSHTPPPRPAPTPPPPVPEPPEAKDAGGGGSAPPAVVRPSGTATVRARVAGGGSSSAPSGRPVPFVRPSPPSGRGRTAAPAGLRGGGLALATARVLDPEPDPAATPVPVRRPGQRRAPQPLAVVPRADRPHVRLGLAWTAITVWVLVAGPGWAAAWMAACAGAAGLQSARVWRKRGERPVTVLAGASAAALPLCALSGMRATIAVAAAAVALSMVAKVLRPAGPASARDTGLSSARDAGLTVTIGLSIGLAASSLVLLRAIDVRAALLLLAYAAAYDVGSYLVGTGASSVVEGPLAGIFALIPVATFSTVLLVPPFTAGSTLLLGVLAAVMAPCGPPAGSVLLGERDASAPALRRLDSLLVLGPVWAWCAAALLS